ncbi:hypothetical protein BDF21DRAFT_104957 [Thamnidium elegans]|nr:hypothetical protein BDF21DRAFT_104957 [Thamnidium elegans]
MGSFVSAFKTNTEDYVELEQEQVVSNQLLKYTHCLERTETDLDPLQASFLAVARSSIINIMGKKQCESYRVHDSFTLTDLNIMRSIHRIPHFDVDKHNEVKHLIDPLKKAFEIGKLNQIEKTIRAMKNIRVYQGNSFTTIDYQLLDILEYITQLCFVKKYNPLTHWTDIFDILFRGTNIKLSNRTSNSNGNKVTKDHILFQCHSQNKGFGRLHNIELSLCGVSLTTNQDEKGSMLQSQLIVSNKTILDGLEKSYDIDNAQGFFPINIQIVGYVGYLYSIRKYKGVFVASQVCESTLFIPRTIDEFYSFLYNDHVLEMLCNLKRHYVNMAKLVRHASITT